MKVNIGAVQILFVVTIILSQNSRAQYTAIPDANFENALFWQGIDPTPGDGQVLTAYIDTLKHLWVDSKGIFDLTGIQDFDSLEYLSCSDNYMTSLNLSQNINLKTLKCIGCDMTSINLSQNTLLEYLQLSLSNIPNIDLTANAQLKYFFCYDSDLVSVNISQCNLLEKINVWRSNVSNLDISNCPNLTSLICGENNISTLDLSQNTMLNYIVCHENNISTLDVSNCPNLDTIYCYSNNLSCLNLKNGNNSNINFISFYDNPSLYCVEVDDPVISTNNWSSANGYYYDSWVSFGEYCANSCSTGIDEVSTHNKEVVKVLDLMGRETEPIPNTPLIYVYSDGTTEKVYKLE